MKKIFKQYRESFRAQCALWYAKTFFFSEMRKMEWHVTKLAWERGRPMPETFYYQIHDRVFLEGEQSNTLYNELDMLLIMFENLPFIAQKEKIKSIHAYEDGTTFYEPLLDDDYARRKIVIHYLQYQYAKIIIEHHKEETTLMIDYLKNNLHGKENVLKYETSFIAMCELSNKLEKKNVTKRLKI